MIAHREAECWKFHPELEPKNGRFKLEMDTRGMDTETIHMTHEEDKFFTIVHSDMDWVISCDHCGATGKTNQNMSMVCKVGVLDRLD